VTPRKAVPSGLFEASDALKQSVGFRSAEWDRLPVEPALDLPPQDGLRVTIRKRVNRGEDPSEEEVRWPEGWPLPQQGSIVLGHTLGGWTEHVEHDLVEGRVIVVLRPQ
jgi:hypothetical protein